MAREIQLTRGYIATVDDADFESVSRFKWHAAPKGKTVYAARRLSTREGKRITYLHIVIMRPPKGFRVDHIDGNGLNCRRANLRVCSHAENLQNRPKSRNNTAGYKGVCWNKAARKWQAQILANGKKTYLGLHLTPEEAAIAYNEAAIQYHGSFARLNEIPTR